MKQNRLLTIIGAVAVLAGGAGATHAQNLIANGDFMANAAASVSWPGYVGGSNPADITGWVGGGGKGVNGAAVGFAASPFGPTDAGGRTYAFIQGVGQLTQDLPVGYSEGRAYQLSFDAAGRAGNPSPSFEVLINDLAQTHSSPTSTYSPHRAVSLP